MPNKNAPMLPGFHCENRGRRRLSYKVKFQRWKTKFDGLGIHEFESFFSDVFLSSSLLKKGEKNRNRVYTRSVVFWAFFVQVLNEKCPCQEIVFLVKNWFVSKKPDVKISSNTAAFVKARSKLCYKFLKKIFVHIRDNVESSNDSISTWYGHCLKVVDGSGLSMPDTDKNQLKWPQVASQKLGCGFPLMKICAVFCLNKGTVLDWKTGNKHDSELTLWSRMWETLSSGDLVVGDRGFCYFGIIAHLMSRNINHVVRVMREDRIDWSRAKRIGKNEWIYSWRKPKRKSKLLAEKDWKSLPDELEVRLIKHRIYENGFRSHEVFVLTTLTDSKYYPAEEIAKVYQRRWDVEVDLRHLKTSMGMDILSCKTPQMVEKEVVMYMIAYNLIRAKMVLAAKAKDIELSRISYKSTIQAFQQTKSFLIGLSEREIQKMKELFYDDITSSTICPKRDSYIEPRVVKRRPKSRMRMSKPRAELRQEIKEKFSSKNSNEKSKKTA